MTTKLHLLDKSAFLESGDGGGNPWSPAYRDEAIRLFIEWLDEQAAKDERESDVLSRRKMMRLVKDGDG